MDNVEFHEKTKSFVVETLTLVNGRSPSSDNVKFAVDSITKAFKPLLKIQNGDIAQKARGSGAPRT